MEDQTSNRAARSMVSSCFFVVAGCKAQVLGELLVPGRLGNGYTLSALVPTLFFPWGCRLWTQPEIRGCTLTVTVRVKRGHGSAGRDCKIPQGALSDTRLNSGMSDGRS
jgi:hypothetical protein